MPKGLNQKRKTEVGGNKNTIWSQNIIINICKKKKTQFLRIKSQFLDKLRTKK